MFLKSNRTILFIILQLITLDTLAQSTRNLSVDELFELAITNSLKVQSSEINTQIYAENLADKKSTMMPSIGVGIIGGYTGDPAIFNNGNTSHPSTINWRQNYNIDLSQPIYTGGEIRNSIDKAALQQSISKLILQRDIAEVKLLLIDKYLTLLRLYKQKEVISESITQATQSLHDIIGMERNGMLTASDRLRSELQLSNYRMALLETTNNIKITSTQIDIVLAIDENTILIPDSTILEHQLSIMPYQTYINMAYEHYPELSIAKSNIEVASKELKIAKSSYIPRLSFGASNVMLRPLTSTYPAQNLYANSWNIGLTLSYNLSSLYHNRQKVNIAKRTINLQNLESKMVEQTIINSVKENYIKHGESLERIATLNISVEQAGENYRIVLNKYKNRIAILTDLLDASTIKLNAQLQLTNAKTTAIYTYYQLLRSSGNL